MKTPGFLSFFSVVALIVLGSATAPLAADPVEQYEKGQKAYRGGDVITAMSLLKPSADSGHAPAQVLLAYILDKSEFDAEAMTLYRKASEQGSAEGDFGLGTMYAAGEGVDKDPAEALRWYRQAAKRGHGQASQVIAIAYLNGGLGLEADREKAIEWLEQAVALGDEAAKERLEKLTKPPAAESTGSKQKK